MHNDYFGDEELAQLRSHGIVLFARRVIFEAQPPMAESQIAALQALCAGPLPPELLALWRQSAGGRIDYDLHLHMNGNEESVVWSDLFWSGSEGPQDLQGWVDHEREAAQEAAAQSGEPWDGKLTLLPFGGFEDSDRIYAVVEPGPDYGHVLAWKQGLPPPWPHEMHEDGMTTVAHDLCAAFEALQLDEDPLAPAGDYFTGQALLEYLDQRHQEHGLSLELMDRLIAFYRGAMVDWRSPLAAGTLGQDAPLARVALRHAIATDDAEQVARLAAAGIALDGPLLGSAIATDLALSHGAHHAAEALVRAGAPVAHDALDYIDSAVSPELVGLLLERGAEPSATAVAECVACGAPAAARLIAGAYAQSRDDLPGAYAAARDGMLAELEAALVEVHAGRLTHYLGPAGLTKRIDHLQSFEL
ncbi:SMI1/KNR4 family protein [Variovorax saccharolyticus]|uniref:SMI1/KNR4 family protein n=1 Tax=Variovorax saccharolyticus TaxID=3053516 RepID=UPI0025791D31|nr:SMI1/KNR4 family protein [Variovorax sp. J22R187]MDM0018549.1 SMI1/KNR4 family protein [Variovorax sp. J22R187]